MKKLLSLLIVTLSVINSFAQKPDYIRTANGPNTIVDWNLKAKTFVLPHGSTLGLFGSQDTTGNIRFIVAPGDTSLNIRIGGLKWWNPANYFAPITGGGYVPNSRQIINGYGITGGHSLATDVTLATDTTHGSSGLLTWNYGLRFVKGDTSTLFNNLVHKTGAETIRGFKTATSDWSWVDPGITSNVIDPYYSRIYDNATGNNLVTRATSITYQTPSFSTGIYFVTPTHFNSISVPDNSGVFALTNDTTVFRSVANSMSLAQLHSNYQPLNAKLTSISALANSAGVLTNDGSGGFSYTTPTTTGAAGGVLSGTYPNPGLAQNISLNGGTANAWNTNWNSIDFSGTYGNGFFARNNGATQVGMGINSYHSTNGGNSWTNKVLGNSGNLVLSNTGLDYYFSGYAAAGTFGVGTSVFNVDTLGRIKGNNNVTIWDGTRGIKVGGSSLFGGGMIWDASVGTPSDTNFSLMTNSGSTTLNSTGNLYFSQLGTTYGELNNTGFSIDGVLEATSYPAGTAGTDRLLVQGATGGNFGSPIKSIAGNYYQQSLTSGANIKTVNSTTLLGSGNLAITPSNTDTTSTGFATRSLINNYLTKALAASTYQTTLSGTGIVKSTSGVITYLTDNTTNWNTAFGWGNHAGLYPTYTGTGASGTWGINITGTSQAVAQAIIFDNSGSGAGSGVSYNGNIAKTISWNTIGAYPATNPSGYISSFTETDPTVPAYAKSLTAFSVIKTSTDALYPLLNGTGATGTWGIGITGNSGTVTNGVYTTTFNGLGDARYLQKSNNLSDLASVSTARTNLGLGTLATQSGTFNGTSSGTNTGDETTIRINALYGYTPANGANYLPLTAESGSPLSGSLYSSVGNTGTLLRNTGNATTGYLTGLYMNNTAGSTQLALEGSTASTFFTNSLAYATLLGSNTNTAVQLGVNNVVKASLLPTGFFGVGYTADPTSGNLLGVNGNGYFNGTLYATGGLLNGTTATTQSANDNSTKVATTAYVDGAINSGSTSSIISYIQTSASTYTTTSTDVLIHVQTVGNCTVNLPQNPVTGRTYIVKNECGSGGVVTVYQTSVGNVASLSFGQSGRYTYSGTGFYVATN